MAQSEFEHSRNRPADNLHDALDIYLSGRSGVRFRDLVRFAGPLFDLYDVDWRSQDPADARQRDRDELSTMVAVLDAARLFWAFLSLEDEEGMAYLPDLEDAMLGSSAGDEERSNLLILLSLLEEHWHAFTPEDRRQAESTPGYALPPFETLLREYSESGPLFADKGPARYGPQELDLPEALALFAEPLLQDEAARSIPDVFEERVVRAHAYWDLAQSSDEDFDQELERIQTELQSSDADAAEIRQEAERMVRRYRKLFQDKF